MTKIYIWIVLHVGEIILGMRVNIEDLKKYTVIDFGNIKSERSTIICTAFFTLNICMICHPIAPIASEYSHL